MSNPLVNHSGRVFGNKQQLTVLEWVKGPSVYKVRCAICAEDAELFGEAVYEVPISFLQKGGIPCGCSKHPMWTPEQYQVKVRRAISGKNVEIFIPSQKFEGGESSVSLSCKVHAGHVWNTTVKSVLKGHGCWLCRNQSIGAAGKRPDELHISEFEASGNFASGSKFWRCTKNPLIWYYLCGVCSYDKYVTEGLCDGIFSATSGRLKAGHLPCRCSTRYRWTQQQREFQIRNTAKVVSGEYEFLGWQECYKGSWTRINMSCCQHGGWCVQLSTYLNGGSLCPTCAPSGYSRAKTGYIYVVTIIGDNSTFVGYGISNVPKRRIATHERELAKWGLRITTFRLFELDGDLADKIESYLLKKYKPYRTDAVGFKRESSDIEMMSNILADITSFDGVIEV